jgi:hypothetical protein
VKHLFKKGATHIVGNGELNDFWEDVWLTSSPLRVCFPKLYNIYRDGNVTMAQCADMEWQFRPRRMLGRAELEEWNELQALLENVCISDEEDEIQWELTVSKVFTTRSLYRLITSGGVNYRVAEKLWGCKIPLKIRIFLWQVFQNRLQTAQQLKAMNWKGDVDCKLCSASEDADHLMFSCPLASFMWAFLNEALGWDGYPRSVNELLAEWLPRKFGINYQTSLTCSVGFAWALWNMRNKMCFQCTFPHRPLDIIYLGEAC